MFNIITPCARAHNLTFIEESINIPEDQYRWIIVFDSPSIPEVYIPKKAEVYAYQENGSVVGHAQRNFALNLINNGHIYFNDDDTVVHPNLWDNIKDSLDIYDFISFDQSNRNGNLRLKGNNIKIDHIDSHNFIVSYILCKDIRFHIDKYNADGYFATDCYAKSRSSLYIQKSLSIYNYLR